MMFPPEPFRTATIPSALLYTCALCARLMAEGDGLPIYRDTADGRPRLICTHVKAAEEYNAPTERMSRWDNEVVRGA